LSNDVVDYVTTRAYASTNDQWARPARSLFSSSKTKLCQFSSVSLRRSVRAFKSITEPYKDICSSTPSANFVPACLEMRFQAQTVSLIEEH